MRTIVLDGEVLANQETAQEYLREMLEFPDYYGKNLDALYDCLGELSQKTHLILQNWDHVAPFAGGFRFVFNDAEEENPNLFITIQ